jgi:hypothetical protein
MLRNQRRAFVPAKLIDFVIGKDAKRILLGFQDNLAIVIQGMSVRVIRFC